MAVRGSDGSFVVLVVRSQQIRDPPFEQGTQLGEFDVTTVSAHGSNESRIDPVQLGPAPLILRPEALIETCDCHISG